MVSSCAGSDRAQKGRFTLHPMSCSRFVPHPVYCASVAPYPISFVRFRAAPLDTWPLCAAPCVRIIAPLCAAFVPHRWSQPRGRLVAATGGPHSHHLRGLESAAPKILVHKRLSSRRGQANCIAQPLAIYFFIYSQFLQKKRKKTRKLSKSGPLSPNNTTAMATKPLNIQQLFLDSRKKPHKHNSLLGKYLLLPVKHHCH